MEEAELVSDVEAAGLDQISMLPRCVVFIPLGFVVYSWRVFLSVFLPVVSGLAWFGLSSSVHQFRFPCCRVWYAVGRPHCTVPILPSQSQLILSPPLLTRARPSLTHSRLPHVSCVSPRPVLSTFHVLFCQIDLPCNGHHTYVSAFRSLVFMSVFVLDFVVVICLVLPSSSCDLTFFLLTTTSLLSLPSQRRCLPVLVYLLFTLWQAKSIVAFVVHISSSFSLHSLVSSRLALKDETQNVP